MNQPTARPTHRLRIHTGWLLAGLAGLVAAAPIVTPRPGATIVDAAQHVGDTGLPRAAELASRIVELRARIPLLERRVERVQGLQKQDQVVDIEVWEAIAARDVAARQLAILTMAVDGERIACEATIAAAATGKTLFESGRMGGPEWLLMDAAGRRAASALKIYDSVAD